MDSTDIDTPQPLPGWLSEAARRLRTITGFITVQPNGGDVRTLAFSRYDHVARVASLALATNNDRSVPRSEVILISWLHDINRWPFAHNAEGDRFDQPGDIERFVAGRLPLRSVRQAAGVAGKNLPVLDKAARVVLLADMVTGFVEDTLFAVTGLGLSPSELPGQTLDLLRMPVGDSDFLEELVYLHDLLNLKLDVPGYIRNFNSLVHRASLRFLAEHDFTDHRALEDDNFWIVRTALRNEYLPVYIFPLNNEKVCHGTLIRRALVDPVLCRLGEAGQSNLTRWSEADFVAYALKEKLITEDTIFTVAPTLDYIQRFEPHRSLTLLHA